MKKKIIVFWTLIALAVYVFFSQRQIVSKVSQVLDIYIREGSVLTDQKVLLEGEYLSKALHNEPPIGSEFQLEIGSEARKYTIFYSYSIDKLRVFHGYGYCQEHNIMEPCHLTAMSDYSVCMMTTGHEEIIYAIDARLSQEQINKRLEEINKVK